MELEPMRPEDWPAVRAIYEAGIATGDATFETTAPDWPAWDAAHLPDHRLVGRVDAGQLDGRWQDVLLLERRSPVIA
jgi:phosphinothricin acetyltransferase